MRVLEVNFTFAIPGGMWIKWESGRVAWHGFDELRKILGGVEVDRLYKIAYHNGMTGMWYNAGNGGNVYADGQLVNAG